MSSSTPLSSLPTPDIDPLVRLAFLEQQIQAITAAGSNAAGVQQQVGIPLVTASKSRPKPPPMVRFTGLMSAGGFEIDSWLREVRKQFSHYGGTAFPDDVARINFAVEWLSGAAQDWWENADKSAIQSWSDFERALRERYRPQMPEEMARQRLRTLVQKGGVQPYCNEFLKLAALIPNRSEEDKIFDFKMGLDRALAAKVAEHKPKTLQEAMEVAVQQEPYVGARSGHGSFRGSSFFYRAPSNTASISRSLGSNSSSGSVPMDVNAVHGSENQDAPEEKEPNAASGFPSHRVPKRENGEEVLKLVLQKIESMDSRLNALSGGGNFGAIARPSNVDRVSGLKPGEISRLQAEGRCFRCREKGHMKRDCPKSRQRLNY
jgi:hypothetical protein